MMTDEDVLKKYNEMLEHFGTLPSPEHEPIQFAHYVKVFDYYNQRKEDDSTKQAD
jgi:hypothetical protein